MYFWICQKCRRKVWCCETCECGNTIDENAKLVRKRRDEEWRNAKIKRLTQGGIHK